jgi:hypothetical protein
MQNLQQRKLQQQQLELDKQRTQAAVALDKAQADRLLAQTTLEAQQRKDESDAAAVFKKAMETTGGKLTEDTILDMFAKVKTPGAVRALAAMLPGLAEALQVPAGMAESKLAERRAIAELDNFEVTQEITRLESDVRRQGLLYAQRLIRNPNKPFRLPADAKMQDAVGLATLGILNQAQTQLELEASGAGGGNQAIIFARMQANQASQAAVRSYFTELEELGYEEMKDRPGPMSRERLEPFLGGMTYDTYLKLTHTAGQGALAALGFEPPPPSRESGIIEEFKKVPAFARLSPVEQEQVIEAARLYNQGAPIVEGTSTSIRALIRNLARRLQQ